MKNVHLHQSFFKEGCNIKSATFFNYFSCNIRVNAPDIQKPYQNNRQLLGENFAFGQTVNVFARMKMTVN